MRIEIEVTAILGKQRIVLGRHPFRVEFGKTKVMIIPCDVRLTPRQSQVLELIVQGEVHKEIAQKLGISVSTAKTHAKDLYKKYAVTDRAELIRHVTNTGKASESIRRI